MPPLHLTQAEMLAAFPELAKAQSTVEREPVARHGDGSKYGKRHVAGEMNKTEAAYSEELEMMKRRGNVIEYWFESITLKLADRCRYTPDFLVLHADGSMELVDVKSPAPIDPKSLVKAKVAAKMFPIFRVVMAQRQKGGLFLVREF